MFEKKSNLIALAIVILAVLVLGGAYQYKKSHSVETNEVAQDNSNIIFFYGLECPHCHNVEKFIADNDLNNKVSFSTREVYHNKPNANLMAEKAKECGISENELGVPLLWGNGKCYIGEEQVENYLMIQAGGNQ